MTRMMMMMMMRESEREGAMVRGTDQVIKSEDSSIKTKRWLPSQTPPKPCQPLPRRELPLDQGEEAED